MTLEATVDTVTTWINSCVNIEQLNLCKDVIEKFVHDRFKHHTPDGAVTAFNQLANLVENRKSNMLIERRKILTEKELKVLQELATVQGQDPWAFACRNTAAYGDAHEVRILIKGLQNAAVDNHYIMSKILGRTALEAVMNLREVDLVDSDG